MSWWGVLLVALGAFYLGMSLMVLMIAASRDDTHVSFHGEGRKT